MKLLCVSFSISFLKSWQKRKRRVSSQELSLFSRPAMPSRKKKQGRARKTKQAETRSSNPNNAASHCDHFECSRNSNWSQDDYAAAIELSIEFSSKFNALIVGSSSSDLVRMAKDHARMVYLVDEVYQKYFQLSNGGKEIFRNYILAYGTEVLVVHVAVGFRADNGADDVCQGIFVR